MKIGFLLTSLFFLLITFSLSANTVHAQESIQSDGFDCNNCEVNYTVSSSDFVNMPSWEPEQNDEPPLSMQRALEIARLNLLRFVKDAKDFKVLSIHLTSSGKNHWYYNFGFECETSECKKKRHHFTIMVKMNGQIIEPKIKLVKPKEKTPEDKVTPDN